MTNGLAQSAKQGGIYSMLSAYRRGNGRVLAHKAREATYVFALPWPMQAIGGVVEVVRQLYRHMETSTDIKPMILVTSWNHVPAGDGAYTVRQLYLTDPWPKVGRLKAVIAFVVKAPAILWNLMRLVQSENVRVINVHFPDTACLCFALLKTLRLYHGRFLVSLHGADIQAALSSRGMERRLWRAILRSADAVVTCSQALAGTVAAFDPALRPKITAVHNGVDPAEFLSRRSDRFGRGSDDQLILSIGKFEHKKGHDVLIRAFERLVQDRPGLRLILIGASGPALGQVRDAVTRAGLEQRVSIYTDLPHHQIPGFLAQADLFVLASRVEPFGIVLLEAAVSQVPVVATAVGGIPEIVTDGASGLLVEPDDPGALADAMRTLLDDPTRATAMAARLHRDALAHFSWENALHQYTQLANLNDKGVNALGQI